MARPRKAEGDPARAVGYVRVSTRDQKLGPGAQREAIQRYAASHGIEVVRWADDIGVSGKAPLHKRPALVDALASWTDEGLLIVAKRDRLIRDNGIGGALLESAIEKVGARVVSACGTGNAPTAEGALTRRIIDAVAAYEREMIAARTRAVLASKRSRGEKSNARPPYGWRHDGDRTVPHPREQKTVDTIRSLRGQGLSIAAIAKRLNEHAKVHPPRGKRWHATTVARVLNAVPA